MFFRWIELRESRPRNPRLPIIAARGNLLLLHSIFHDPYFRAVIVGGIANHHDLKNWILRGEIEFVVELRDERTKFFQESDADGFQVRFTLAGSLVTGVGA